MTTLIGYQGDGWSVLGADSRTTDEHGRLTRMATSKIVENNGIIIAGSGTVRGSNILHHGWKAPRPTANQDLDKFMTQVFIPQMRKAFIDAGYDMKEDGDAATHDSEFLVSVRGTLYVVFDDYSWDRDIRGIYYSGSGSDVAVGVVEALRISDTETPEKAEEIIRTAIEIAAEWDAFTNPPIITKIQFK